MILGFSMITDQMTNHTKRRFVMEHLGRVCSTHAPTNTTGICRFVTGQTATPSPTVCRSGSGEETRRRCAGDGELMAEIVHFFIRKTNKALAKMMVQRLL